MTQKTELTARRAGLFLLVAALAAAMAACAPQPQEVGVAPIQITAAYHSY